MGLSSCLFMPSWPLIGADGPPKSCRFPAGTEGVCGWLTYGHTYLQKIGGAPLSLSIFGCERERATSNGSVPQPVHVQSYVSCPGSVLVNLRVAIGSIAALWLLPISLRSDRSSWESVGLTVKHPLQPLPRSSNCDTRWTPVDIQ
jgi:hypothetical protein